MLPTPAPIPEPALAQEPVAALLAHFATALPWLSHAYGLVQTGVLKDGKSKYPQLYLQNGGLASTGLWPDEAMKALCFFELNGEAELTFTDPTNRAGTITHNLAAVVWVNLPAIDAKRGYDFSPLLAEDFLVRGLLRGLPAGQLTPAGIEQRAERVFQRYNFPQERQQLLMWPFAGFRIPFTVARPYVACASAFAPLS